MPTAKHGAMPAPPPCCGSCPPEQLQEAWSLLTVLVCRGVAPTRAHPRLCRDGKDTSPLTNDPLPHKLLLPCPTVRRCMEEIADFIDSVRSLAL